jgi:hypothetical protein
MSEEERERAERNARIKAGKGLTLGDLRWRCDRGNKNVDKKKAIKKKLVKDGEGENSAKMKKAEQDIARCVTDREAARNARDKAKKRSHPYGFFGIRTPTFFFWIKITRCC